MIEQFEFRYKDGSPTERVTPIERDYSKIQELYKDVVLLDDAEAPSEQSDDIDCFIPIFTSKIEEKVTKTRAKKKLNEIRPRKERKHSIF